MSSTSTYISNSKIKFNDNKDFIFTFDVAGSKHRNFNLSFKINDNKTCLNKFSIRNDLDNFHNDNYITDDFSKVKKVIVNTNKPINFFKDVLVIYDKEVYKQISGESRSEIKGFYRKDEKLYIKTDLYSYSIENGKPIISRKNPQLPNGEYLRPVAIVKSYQLENKINEVIEYFDTLDNPINSNENKTYRIIVSDRACLISLLIKEGEAFRAIKNFTYPPTQVIDEGTITLEIDDNMELSNLHFSFFEA